MAGQTFTGTEGKISLNGADIHVTGWEATETTQFYDSTDTSSGGFIEEEPGNSQLSGTGTFQIKRGANWVLDKVRSVKLSGGTVTRPTAKFYFQSATGSYIDCSAINIKNVRITSQQAGLIQGTFEWASHGSYTIPTSFA